MQTTLESSNSNASIIRSTHEPPEKKVQLCGKKVTFVTKSETASPIPVSYDDLLLPGHRLLAQNPLFAAGEEFDAQGLGDVANPARRPPWAGYALF